MLYHDSHDAQYRDPLGPVAAGNRLTLRFACDESPEVLLRTWDGAQRLYPMVSVGAVSYTHLDVYKRQRGRQCRSSRSMAPSRML